MSQKDPPKSKVVKRPASPPVEFDDEPSDDALNQLVDEIEGPREVTVKILLCPSCRVFQNCRESNVHKRLYKCTICSGSFRREELTFTSIPPRDPEVPLTTFPLRRSYSSPGYEVLAMQTILIRAKQLNYVPLGVAIDMPVGVFFRIVDRASYASKFHVVGGIVDADYKLQVVAQIYNPNEKDVTVEKGERFCQLVAFSRVDMVEYVKFGKGYDKKLCPIPAMDPSLKPNLITPNLQKDKAKEGEPEEKKKNDENPPEEDEKNEEEEVTKGKKKK